MRPIFEILSNLPSADSLILHFSAFQNSSRVIFTKDLGWLPIQRVTTATDRVKHVSQGFTASSLRHLSHTSIALRRRGEGMQTLKGGICWQSRTLSTIRWSGLPRTHSKAAMSHPLLPLLVSCGHHNKAPQVWWLRTIGIYSLTVLETRSLKSVIWGGGAMLLPETQRIHSSPLPPSRWLQAFLGLYLHHSNLYLCSHILSFSLVKSPLNVPYKDTCH